MKLSFYLGKDRSHFVTIFGSATNGVGNRDFGPISLGFSKHSLISFLTLMILTTYGSAFANPRCEDLLNNQDSNLSKATQHYNSTGILGLTESGLTQLRNNLVSMEKVNPNSPLYDRDFANRHKRDPGFAMGLLNNILKLLEAGANPYSLVRISEPINDAREWLALLGEGSKERRFLAENLVFRWNRLSESQKSFFWQEYATQLMTPAQKEYGEIANRYPHLSFLKKPVDSGFHIPDPIAESSSEYSSTLSIHRFHLPEGAERGPRILKRKSLRFGIQSPADFVKRMQTADSNLLAKNPDDALQKSVQYNLSKMFPPNSKIVLNRNDIKKSEYEEYYKHDEDWVDFQTILADLYGSDKELARIELNEVNKNVYYIELIFKSTSLLDKLSGLTNRLTVRIARNGDVGDFYPTAIRVTQDAGFFQEGKIAVYDTPRSYFELELGLEYDTTLMGALPPTSHTFYFKKLEDISPKHLD